MLAAILLHVPESATVERCAVRLVGHADIIAAAAKQVRAALIAHAAEKESVG